MANWLKCAAGMLVTIAILWLQGVEFEAAKYQVVLVLASSGLTFFFLHEHMESLGFMEIGEFIPDTTPAVIWKSLGVAFGLIALACIIFWRA